MKGDDSKKRSAALGAQPGYRAPGAFGVGIATRSILDGVSKTLDVRFSVLALDEHPSLATLLAAVTGADGSAGTFDLDADRIATLREGLAALRGEAFRVIDAALLDALSDICVAGNPFSPRRRIPVVTVLTSLDAAPLDAHDIYLRLHLISSRRTRPHGCNLDNIFGLLNNVVWTSAGPFDPQSFEVTRAVFEANGTPLHVRSLDKFPPMLDYVIPTGVRVADAARVRLGAHLAEGTTVMHEGFVNYNAGTLGPAMVEGRISAGVVIGANTDLGGSASIMGTLSGGGKETVSVGERCLLGANSGLGISLGDNCVVEAGLYLTAGTLVTMPDDSVVKARALSGLDDMLFRRNSLSGAVEMIPQTAQWSGLNSVLHAND